MKEMVAFEAFARLKCREISICTIDSEVVGQDMRLELQASFKSQESISTLIERLRMSYALSQFEMSAMAPGASCSSSIR